MRNTKNAKSRLPALLLALALLIPALPATARAVGVTPLETNGVQLSGDGTVMYWDAANNQIPVDNCEQYGFSWDGSTLTLFGAQITSNDGFFWFWNCDYPTIVLQNGTTSRLEGEGGAFTGAEYNYTVKGAGTLALSGQPTLFDAPVYIPEAGPTITASTEYGWTGSEPFGNVVYIFTGQVSATGATYSEATGRFTATSSTSVSFTAIPRTTPCTWANQLQVFDGDEYEYNSKKVCAPGWSWDLSTKTLTLDHITIGTSGKSAIASSYAATTIVIRGDVYLSADWSGGQVISEYNDFVIRGEGAGARLHLSGNNFAIRPTNLTLEGDLTLYADCPIDLGGTLTTTNGKIKNAGDGGKNLEYSKDWQGLPSSLTKPDESIYKISPYSSGDMIITVGSASAGGGGGGGGGGASEGGSVIGIDPSRGDYGAYDPENPTAAYNPVGIDIKAFQAELTVYAVDVEWGAMTFRYIAQEWDPETMTWQSGGAPGWQVYDHETDTVVAVDCAINAVTVTNRSNAPVEAAFAYGEADGSGIQSGTFSGDTRTSNTFTLLTANNDEGAGDGVGAATEGTAHFMPSGEPADLGREKFTKIGTITVTVSPAA